MYMAYKHFHLLMVVLSVSFLLVRYAMSLKPAAILQRKFFKIAPHVIDTLLLVSAVLLMLTLQQYPFVHAWLTEKFFAVLAYIVARMASALKERGWRMNSLQLPPALHFCVTGPNTQPGVAGDFLADLRVAVDYAVAHRGEPAQSGAMYGFGAMPDGDQTLRMVMGGVLDAMHSTAPDSRLTGSTATQKEQSWSPSAYM